MGLQLQEQTALVQLIRYPGSSQSITQRHCMKTHQQCYGRWSGARGQSSSWTSGLFFQPVPSQEMLSEFMRSEENGHMWHCAPSVLLSQKAWPASPSSSLGLSKISKQCVCVLQSVTDCDLNCRIKNDLKIIFVSKLCRASMEICIKAIFLFL